ncbi:hypothetical protein P168DRAFT_283316 [Aspergillus campestris IBT 28561]|uniref:Uncharacterized protein n=1 Tax=Aspergillus campestris (strain IBT 28561) TaxID=1392248 RepID=A0A2I1CY50_ASPC2|nr:uncharacterized protein P168DRAFT_283316 [Aspergillus campestris IBT 28561]PKY02543.1 hypothetical protein P168DRAFT_283316 [Aspergillus campestris IBT 28561]
MGATDDFRDSAHTFDMNWDLDQSHPIVICFPLIVSPNAAALNDTISQVGVGYRLLPKRHVHLTPTMQMHWPLRSHGNTPATVISATDPTASRDLVSSIASKILYPSHGGRGHQVERSSFGLRPLSRPEAAMHLGKTARSNVAAVTGPKPYAPFRELMPWVVHRVNVPAHQDHDDPYQHDRKENYSAQ